MSDLQKYSELRQTILAFDSQLNGLPENYKNSTGIHAVKWRKKHANRVQKPEKLIEACDTWLSLPSDLRVSLAAYQSQVTGRKSYLDEEVFVDTMIEGLHSIVHYENFHFFNMTDLCITINKFLREKNSEILFDRITFIRWIDKFFDQDKEFLQKHEYALKFFDELYDIYRDNKEYLIGRLDVNKNHAQKDTLMFFLGHKFKEYKPQSNNTNIEVNTNVATGINLNVDLDKLKDIPITSSEQDIDFD